MIGPPADNLNICPDHRLPMHSRQRKRMCPACELDMDVQIRHDAPLPANKLGMGTLTQTDVRLRLDAETIVELLPLMEEYLDDTQGEANMWLSTEKFEGKLPAGYSEAQERWVTVVGYTFGSREKAITQDSNAKETIETLRENGYGKEIEA